MIRPITIRLVKEYDEIVLTDSRWSWPLSEPLSSSLPVGNISFQGEQSKVVKGYLRPVHTCGISKWLSSIVQT